MFALLLILVSHLASLLGFLFSRINANVARWVGVLLTFNSRRLSEG